MSDETSDPKPETPADMTIPAPAPTMPSVPGPADPDLGAELVARLAVKCADIVIVRRTLDGSRWITVAGDACESCLLIAASWCRRSMGYITKKAAPKRAGVLSLAMSSDGCVREHCHTVLLALSKRGRSEPDWYVCPDLPTRTGKDDIDYVCAACERELRAWTQSPMSGILFLTDERVAAIERDRRAQAAAARTAPAGKRSKAPRHKSRRGD